MQGKVKRANFSETVMWYLNSKCSSRNKKNLHTDRSKPVLYHPVGNPGTVSWHVGLESCGQVWKLQNVM